MTKCKRRIPLALIDSVTMSEVSDEFVVHVPGEYDYRMMSLRKQDIVACLADNYQSLTGEKLVVTKTKQIVLKSVTKKIGLMDEIIKQRHQLKDLRLVKENYERKLQQLEESDRKASTSPDVVRDYDVQMRTIQQKIATSREKYDALLTELSAAIAFFVKEAGVEGGTKLLAPELSAFRSSQFQFFLLCQKLIAGKDADVGDLEAQWKAFARRMSTTVANAKAGVKKLDGKSHVMWREDVETLPVPGVGPVPAFDAPASVRVPASVAPPAPASAPAPSRSPEPPARALDHDEHEARPERDPEPTDA